MSQCCSLFDVWFQRSALAVRLLCFAIMVEQKPDFAGLLPESWLCVDCGVNTAPGLKSRVELELALTANDSAEVRINENSEIYTVRDKIWKKARMEPVGGCLCIGCLEKRIGRELRPTDFDRPISS
jgi:hypothetical protein